MELLENEGYSVKGTPHQFDLQKENFGIFSNLTLLSMLLVSLTRNRTFFPPKQTFRGTYDYIIVGAGTAGSVLANRLTEKPCVRVLLLEAGGEPPILTDVPGFAAFFYGSQIDWHYKTVPQKFSGFSLKENRIILNNGKVLGGSSTINGMQSIKGNKKNYDDWEADGATGWSYKDVLPYFKKLENSRKLNGIDRDYHGLEGPVNMEYVNYNPEIKEPIIQALRGMGYRVRDANGKRQTSIMEPQVTARNQQRHSAFKGYLNPVRQRPNLDILTKAYARKVLIRSQSGVNKAYGVEFDFNGKTHRVRARKEVILASGAIKTPQILMLSGIGPKKHLQKFNIKVVADLPVGKNLMDHVGNFLVYTVSDEITDVSQKLLNPLNVLDYVFHRRGPLCAPIQVNLLGFVNGTDYTTDFPQQELTFAEFPIRLAQTSSNLKDEVFDALYKPYLQKPSFVCFNTVLQPHSRGVITLKSTDPHENPLIDPRYYADKRDLKIQVEGMKTCNRVARHPALKKIGAKPLKTVVPGCESYVGDDDKYLACFARHLPTTQWHFSGTAKMGHKDDPRSVVDPQLRVIGVDGLRVVNAAVMPIVTSGNLMVPVLMIAEKASDMIKEGIICERKHSCGS